MNWLQSRRIFYLKEEISDKMKACFVIEGSHYNSEAALLKDCAAAFMYLEEQCIVAYSELEFVEEEASGLGLPSWKDYKKTIL